VSAFMFVVHTSNCHGQNCTRRAIYRLGIDTLIANILVLIFTETEKWNMNIRFILKFKLAFLRNRL